MSNYFFNVIWAHDWKLHLSDIIGVLLRLCHRSRWPLSLPFTLIRVCLLTRHNTNTGSEWSLCVIGCFYLHVCMYITIRKKCLASVHSRRWHFPQRGPPEAVVRQEERTCSTFGHRGHALVLPYSGKVGVINAPRSIVCSEFNLCLNTVLFSTSHSV